MLELTNRQKRIIARRLLFRGDYSKIKVTDDWNDPNVSNYYKYAVYYCDEWIGSIKELPM